MKYLLIVLVLLASCSRNKRGDLDGNCINGDCKDGFGTFLFSHGDRATGQWENGKLNGSGSIIFGKGRNEGDTYEGEFKNNLMHGKGIYYKKQYDFKLYGNFQNGLPHGNCEVIFGINSVWTDTFRGTWISGYCKEFNERLVMLYTELSEERIFTAENFYTILAHQFISVGINELVNKGKYIQDKIVSGEKIQSDDIMEFINLYNKTKNNLSCSYDNINSIKEFDPDIKLKQATLDYFEIVKLGLENEFSTYILLIQHDSDKEKLKSINSILSPFLEKEKKYITIMQNTIDRFKRKYNIK